MDSHRLRHLLTPHSHASVAKVDTALESSRARSARAADLLIVLGVTAVLDALAERAGDGIRP